MPDVRGAAGRGAGERKGRGGRGGGPPRDAADEDGRGQQGEVEHLEAQQGGRPAGEPEGRATRTNAKHINAALVKAADVGDISGLLNIAAANLNDMTCVNISTALHKLARLARDGRVVSASDHRFAALHARTEWELCRQVREGSNAEVLPRCWSTIAWAYGKIQAEGIEATGIFNALSQLSLPYMDRFHPFELTNLIWGFAKMQAPNFRLFQAAQQHVLGCVSQFSAANLSTVAWACVTARRWQCNVLQQIAEEFVRQLPAAQANRQVSPVEISNLMWSLATASVQVGGLVPETVGDVALQLLGEFKIQELSITTWAFSRLDIRHDRLFAAAAWHVQHSPGLQQQVHSQGVANLLWAFEKQKGMGSAASQQLEAAVYVLLPACRRLLPQLKQQEFACVFRALGRMGLCWGSHPEGDALFAAGAEARYQLLCTLSVPQVMDILEAFTRFLRHGGGHEHRPPAFADFLASLVHLCLEKVGELKSPSVTHLVCETAAATPLLGRHRAHLVASIAALALRLGPESFQPSGQATLAAMCGLVPQEAGVPRLRHELAQLAEGAGAAPAGPVQEVDAPPPPRAAGPCGCHGPTPGWQHDAPQAQWAEPPPHSAAYRGAGAPWQPQGPPAERPDAGAPWQQDAPPPPGYPAPSGGARGGCGRRGAEGAWPHAAPRPPGRHHGWGGPEPYAGGGWGGGAAAGPRYAELGAAPPPGGCFQGPQRHAADAPFGQGAAGSPCGHGLAAPHPQAEPGQRRGSGGGRQGGPPGAHVRQQRGGAFVGAAGPLPPQPDQDWRGHPDMLAGGPPEPQPPWWGDARQRSPPDVGEPGMYGAPPQGYPAQPPGMPDGYPPQQPGRPEGYPPQPPPGAAEAYPAPARPAPGMADGFSAQPLAVEGLPRQPAGACASLPLAAEGGPPQAASAPSAPPHLQGGGCGLGQDTACRLSQQSFFEPAESGDQLGGGVWQRQAPAGYTVKNTFIEDNEDADGEEVARRRLHAFAFRSERPAQRRLPGLADEPSEAGAAAPSWQQQLPKQLPRPKSISQAGASATILEGRRADLGPQDGGSSGVLDNVEVMLGQELRSALAGTLRAPLSRQARAEQAAAAPSDSRPAAQPAKTPLNPEALERKPRAQHQQARLAATPELSRLGTGEKDPASYVVKNTFIEAPDEGGDESEALRERLLRFRSEQPRASEKGRVAGRPLCGLASFSA
ncbi:unnamed protein product, partial [Prorocentrum cordatum]